MLGTGRFVLLYDPEEPEAWGGPFRVVCFAQAPLETDIGLDPFVAGVAWSWLEDALAVRGAHYAAASGTATKVISTGFGELAGQSVRLVGADALDSEAGILAGGSAARG